MSKYLINTIETFRIDSETEAKQFIENMANCDGEIVKHSIEYKEQKSKGEVIQSWYRVTIKRVFNDEKDPIDSYNLSTESINFNT
jgi:hypothetical protein